MVKTQVVILDFGSQYSTLVAKTVRDLGIFCEVVPYNLNIKDVLAKNPKAIIFSGGPSSVYDKNAFLISKEYFNTNIPILGICYGMQLIAHLLEGVVNPSKKEYGKAFLELIEPNCTLLAGIPNNSQVWMSHGDCVTKVPSNFKIIAKSSGINAIIKHIEKNIYGVQFHPEVTHSIYGKELLSNFLFKIAQCESNWHMQDYITETIKLIKQTVGNKKVILGLSGGIDSSVAALLINKAIGKQLTCIFVDTGLLRKNEKTDIQETYSKNFDLNIIYVDAKQKFLKALKGISDPEEKRKIIGHEFINTFKDTIKDVKDVKFLAQGTIYPDIIESSTSNNPSHVIKSHHNVGGLPEDLNLKLLEPLKHLFKDEVKKIGKLLNLSPKILQRHPSPGPGLAIRIVGEITEEKIFILQHADNIFIEELNNFDWYNKVSQALVVLLPVKSVGVMGDKRSYELTAVLRAVNTSNFMTAEASYLPFELIEKVVSRIVNEVKGINRVLYDYTSKPPATIEWE